MNTTRFVFGIWFCLLGMTSSLQAQEPRYSQHIQPFFNKYCSECHNAKRPRAGLDLESIKGLRNGSDNGSVFEPGQADKSLLVLVVEGKKKPIMPPKNKPQPKPEEVALLRAWITAGAKVDSNIAKVVLPTIRSKVDVDPPISALAYHPDNKRLFVGTYQKVTSVDPWTREVQGQLAGFSGKITALAVSPDGRWLAVASGTPGEPSALHLYPVPGPKEPWSPGVEVPNAHQDVIHQLQFHPSSKILASCSYDKQVKLWDVASGKTQHTLTDHSDSVYGVTFRPDGKLLATTAADRTVKVWQTETAKLLYTLGESTDWLYTVAWSPDGKRLAAAGVDKSIRVWKVDEDNGEVVQSVFAHQDPVVKLVYSEDGKTLYSIGQDGTAKAWDSLRMVEKKIYPQQAETILTLALSPDQKQLALGRFDGQVVLLDADSGKEKAKISPATLDEIWEREPNNSPGRGELVNFPTKVMTIAGKMNKAGDQDYFRFEAQAGQQLGVKVEAIKTEGKEALEPLLELTNESGQVVAQSGEGYLGFTFEKAGAYSLGIRDQDFRGGDNLKYRLHMGRIPVLTSIFPLGLPQGGKAEIQVNGVHLGENSSVWVQAKENTSIGSKLPVPVKSPHGQPLGSKSVVVGEFPEVTEQDGEVMSLTVPGTGNGRISQPGETDMWKFSAKKGETLIIEVNARRLGSDLDSFIEILDTKGEPVARVTLRSLAQTYVTFRDHNSRQGNIRIEAWSELTVNDYIYLGTEVIKIRALPTHPDADCNFFTEKGQRVGYFGTTPTYHTKGEPMYKVSVHPPGKEFPPNGFPVVTLNYRNDDGGPGLGRDSRLTFEAPADSEYLIRIGDSRNQGGENYAYRLTVRHPRPNFNIRFSPTTPSVWKGGAVPITVTADRIDGFSGPIEVKLDNLPAGFDAPQTTIPAGENETTFALWADADAQIPQKVPPLKLLAYAQIGGKKVEKTATGGVPKVVEPGDIVTTTRQSSVSLKPGGRTKLTVSIERRKGFKGRVPIDVQGLPHGVKVLDIGLNGILITEKETQRTMVLYCEPWVTPMNHPIVVTARREGRNTQHSARSVLLKIVPKK